MVFSFQVFSYTADKEIRTDDLCLDVSRLNGPVTMLKCHHMRGNQLWEYDAEVGAAAGAAPGSRGSRSLRAGRSFPMEHGRTAGLPASAGVWWHHVPVASPARARTRESTAIQLTDGFYTVFPQSFLFRGVKKSFVVQKR